MVNTVQLLDRLDERVLGPARVRRLQALRRRFGPTPVLSGVFAYAMSAPTKHPFAESIAVSSFVIATGLAVLALEARRHLRRSRSERAARLPPPLPRPGS